MTSSASRLKFWLSFVLGWALTIFIIEIFWSFPFETGELANNDDYVRMLRVFDVLDGTVQKDFLVSRLGLNGAEVPWSPLVDWPIAAIQGLLELSMPRMDAALYTTAVIPAAVLFIFYLVALWYTRSLVELKNVFPLFLSVFIGIIMLRQFMPGRVDHHMWQIILVTAAYAGMLRFYMQPDRLLYPAISGLALATGMAIGADVLPWIALNTTLGGIFWLFCGKTHEKGQIWYGIATFTGVLAYFLLFRPENRLLIPVCDSISTVYLAISLAIPLFWSAIHLIPDRYKQNFLSRVLISGVIALPIAVILYKLFPQCAHDPYLLDDQILHEIWLDHVLEAKSIITTAHEDKAIAVMFVLSPLLGFVTSIFASMRDKDRRVMWTGLGIILFFGLILGFYQVRTMEYVQALSIAPLCYLFMKIADGFGAVQQKMNFSKQQRIVIASAIFGFGIVMFGLTATQEKDQIDVPVEDNNVEASIDDCSVIQAAELLNTLPDSLRIAAYFDHGSELLYRTKHQVFSAPYHRNEAGIIAAYHILTAPDHEAAQKYVQEYNVDIVMVCPAERGFWQRLADEETGAFVFDLIDGNNPIWLSQLGNEDKTGGFKIYRVQPFF